MTPGPALLRAALLVTLALLSLPIRCGAELSWEDAHRGAAAPWYCPPPFGADARTCARKFRLGPNPYLEETFIPWSIRTLLALVEEAAASAISEVFNITAPVQTLLAVLEAIRILACSIRFMACYEEQSLRRAQSELCDFLARQRRMLRMGIQHIRALKAVTSMQVPWQSQVAEEEVCSALLGRGDMGALLRAVSQPLQALVQLVLPEAAPSSLGNAGTRFDFEFFHQARARLFLQRGSPGAPMPPSVTYPAIFSPGGACPAAAVRSINVLPHVETALSELVAEKVPLSHFVVNFGAADGECGAGDDWNADPANCLVIAGAAGVLVEGSSDFHPLLQERFSGRSNVTLIKQYLELGNVTALLHKSISSMPTASWSPDLLKMDLDHADCLFLQEALRVVHPKLIHLEFLPSVPPPLDYAQQYQPHLLTLGLEQRSSPLLSAGTTPDSSLGLGREFPGCSLTAFLSRAPGYALLASGDNEALLVRRDLHRLMRRTRLTPNSDLEAWTQGALCHPLRSHVPGTFRWGFDFRILADNTLPAEMRRDLLAELLEGHQASKFTLRLSSTRP